MHSFLSDGTTEKTTDGYTKAQMRSHQLYMLRGVFNKFPDFFVQAFKIVVDSWKFNILLLYILWDDWPIFMISASNE